ncbi:MAG: outer membrane protein transport protein [Longimicrobiales bacterium]|nr:outer membrane protein transport protein [Longimicrobiales bacterium]
MGRRTLRPVGFALLLGALAAPAAGQGSSVYNQSGCVSAKAGAAVASPCADASSVYYNPALISMLPASASAGFTAVYNFGSFTYDTTGTVVDREVAVPVVPQAYAAFRFGAEKRLAAGIGLWAPYGLGIEWPESFEGRFISWKTQLRGIYVQPTLAYEVVPGKLAVGGGVQLVSGGIEINRNLDAPVENLTLASLGVPLETDFASAVLEGSGMGIGGQLAVYYQVTDRLALGARYMLPVTVDLTGTADFEMISNPDIILALPPSLGGPTPMDSLVAPQFEAGGALADQDAEASLTFPPQAVIGFRYEATDALGLAFDYQWTGWSTFDELVATFSGAAPELALTLSYNDTHTLRSGLTYALSPMLEGRAGFIYNTAASPDQTVTPILPEAERQLYTVGFGYRMGPIQADLYYNFVNQADRRGRVRSALPGRDYTDPDAIINDLNVGVYSTTAHLVGLTLSYVFGDER